MSIIHDALKKVQQSMQEIKKEEKPEPPLKPAQKTSEDKPPLPWGPLLMALAVIIGSSYYIIIKIQEKNPNFLSSLHIPRPPRNHPPTPTEVIQQIKANLPVIEKKSIDPSQLLKPMKQINSIKNMALSKMSKSTAKPMAQVTIPQDDSFNNSTITLNVKGIMADPKGNLALIDNEVYEEGSVVHGIKIVKINLDAIILEKDGKQQTVMIRK